MSKPLIFLALVAFAAAARADFVIQQRAEAESGGVVVGGCDVTMKIKGDKIRVDTVCGPSANISKIMDLNTGISTTLIHQQKLVVNEKSSPGAITNAVPPKLRDLGRTETVAGYPAEIYTWTNHGLAGTVWVARNFPNYAKIRPQLEKMSKMSEAEEPDVYAVGMVVKIKEDQEGQMSTSLTLVSAKQEAVNAAVFEIPKDYKAVNPPGH